MTERQSLYYPHPAIAIVEGGVIDGRPFPDAPVLLLQPANGFVKGAAAVDGDRQVDDIPSFRTPEIQPKVFRYGNKERWGIVIPEW